MKTFVNLLIVVTIGTMLTSPIISGQQTTSAHQTSGTSLSPTFDRKHKDKTIPRDRSPVTRVKKDRINRVRPSSSPRISSSLATYRSPIITTSALADTVIRTATWGPDSSIAERDDGNLTYPLPFTFPYFGRSIVAIDVNTNGLLELLESGESCIECGDYNTHYDSVHVDSSMDAIFALNDDLVTSTIIEGTADAVKVSWFGYTYYDDDPYYDLSFSVTLFSDGRIQWKYFEIDYDYSDGDLFSGLYDAVGDLELAVPDTTWGEPVHQLFEFDPAAPDTILQLAWNTNDPSMPFEDDYYIKEYYNFTYYPLPFTFPFLGRDIDSLSFNTNGLLELLEVTETDSDDYDYSSHCDGEYKDAIFVANDDLETGIVVEGNSQQVDIYWYGTTYDDYAYYTFMDSGITVKLTLFRNGGIHWKFFDMGYTEIDCDLFSGLASIDAGVELEVPGGSDAFNDVQVYTAFRFNGPPTAEDDAAATAEDNPVLIDVLANDTEAEGDALSVVNITQGTYGAVVNNGDGTVTYTPEAEYSGADSFTYTASDGISGTDTATVSLTVTSVNDAPTVAAISDQAAIDKDAGQQSVNLTGIGTGAANETQTLTVTATSSNTGLIPDPAVTYTSPAATGTLTYTPVADAYGTATITVVVKDDGGTANSGVDSVQTTFTVTVNDAPVAVADTVTTPEDTAVTVLVLANDSDADGDTLTIASVTQGNHGVVAIEEGDTTLTYTPNANFWGVDSLTYTVSDGKSGLNTATVLVTVTSVNDPPVAFMLVSPGHDSTLVITNANLGDTLTFAWEGAVDVDGDTVRYGAELTGDLGAILIFGDTTATEVRLPHAAVAELMEGLGLLTITGTWDIFATDGEYTTWAENGPFALTIDGTTLDVLRQALLPETFALHQNYPNPFNPATTIQFDLPMTTTILIVVYDLLGREVVRLVEDYMEPGYHQIQWDSKDQSGHNVPSGIYIARLVTAEYTYSIKMVLMK
ncbi:hypothetical protein ES703_19670 [subsurface metagenome]|nr:tandem-95 repeat protein [Dehalococcoidia bacterium]